MIPLLQTFFTIIANLFISRKHVPTIVQSERAECSLACIGMILNYHGHKVDLVTLRKTTNISSKGVSLQGLMNIAEKHGLSSTPLMVDTNHLHELTLPCILHWDNNHFVVLTKISNNYITIHDPAFGIKKIHSKELTVFFKGIVVELQPNKHFVEKKTIKKLKLRDLLKLNINITRTVSYLIFLSFITQVLAMSAPIFTQIILDKVVVTKTDSIILPLVAGFTLLLLIRNITSYFNQWLSLHFSNKLSYQMATKVFLHLIRLPVDYFDRKDLGDISSRFESIHHIRDVITGILASSIVNILMILITASAMLFYSLTISLIVFSFILIFIIVRLFFYHRERTLTEETYIGHAQHESHFLETIRSMQAIKIFQKEKVRQQMWQIYLSNAYDKDIRLSKLHLNLNTFTEMIFGIEYLTTVFLASMAVQSSNFSIGMLFAYLGFKIFFIDSSRTFLSEALRMRLIELHLRRLSDIMLTNTDLFLHQEINSKNSKTLSIGTIEVKKLTFSYSADEAPIFENLNFKIIAGESIAIVGPSGCGKTTLLKCLMGLIKPTSGEILIDGRPLNKVLLYRNTISAVMQDDKLLAGTIAENIACFDKIINHHRIYEVSELAAINKDIEGMPMKFQSIVGELGNSLSGGQKQRIEIARALYKQPQYLFMDEATSHLDLQNERIINKNIQALGITRILVAHRPETIKSADKIIYLNKLNER